MRTIYLILLMTICALWGQEKTSKTKIDTSNVVRIKNEEVIEIQSEIRKPSLGAAIRRKDTSIDAGKKPDIIKKIRKINRMLY